MATKPNKVVFAGDMFSQHQIIYLGSIPATVNAVLLRFTRIIHTTGKTFDHANIQTGTFQTELYHPEIQVLVKLLKPDQQTIITIFGKVFNIKIRNYLDQTITIIKEIETEDTQP